MNLIQGLGVTALVLAACGGCQTLPIEPAHGATARRALPPAISTSPEGHLHLDLAKSPAIPASGPVRLRVAFSVPPEFFVDPGTVAVVLVNGKSMGTVAYDTQRLNGRRDGDFDLTPGLTDGINQITFRSIVARGPNGKTTQVARVLSDSQGTLVKFQSIEIDSSSDSYFLINETWEIDWHRGG